MKRSYLFLQGPHGPFFAMLGRQLASRGHRVARVNFNGGDWYDWKGNGAIRFSGDLPRWDDFCGDLLHRHQITDLVVYGDCRPVHRQAIKLARTMGVRIHVFEEGYIRPDWVTLEEGGVNGYSSLPRRAEWYLEAARDLDEPAHSEVGPSLRPQIWHCIQYYLASMLLRPFFIGYRTHRPCHPVREGLFWLQRFPRLRREQKRSGPIEEELLSSGKPYFLVCLQVSVDSQITCHSPFSDMKGFIATVLDSFIRHAPADACLVFKNHPLDHGGVDYRQLITARGAARGLGGRFRYLESGRLPELIKGAKGVVLVNSTVGTSALFHGRPTIALGESVYNFGGLTYQGGLDAFWKDPVAPDRKVFKAFRRCLLHKVLVNGGFYNPAARARLLGGVVPRLEGRVAPGAGRAEEPGEAATQDVPSLPREAWPSAAA